MVEEKSSRIFTKSLPVRMTDKQYKDVESMAVEKDRSMAWIVRQSVDDYLAKHGRSKSSASAES